MPSNRKPPHPSLTRQRIAQLIKSDARAILLRHETVKRLISAVKQARLTKGLTLGEVGERSSIGKANLCRLENDLDPNPTLDTLLRYAEAVGVEIHVNVNEAA